MPWGPEDVERVARERIGTLAGLVARFAESARGTLVLNTLPLPRRFAAQLVDHRSRARLGAVWREANARLLRLAEEHERVVVLDLDPLVGEGVPVVEPRLSQYTRAHLSPALLAAYAREIGHLARHRAGQVKKALVLDLDGTLWGGILGEDGPDGIETGTDGTHRGGAHFAFQRVVGQLAAQGVLLAAVSKNDPEPVGEVLRGHPGMFLREGDFVRVVANWRPKHDNLAELAEALNLGVDSFVFVDDSPYECGLVRHELPGVSVVPVNGEPALHTEALLRDGWFDAPELTREDVTRVAQYRDELVRKDFLDSFDSLDEYLRQLRVEVHLVERRPDRGGPALPTDPAHQPVQPDDPAAGALRGACPPRRSGGACPRRPGRRPLRGQRHRGRGVHAPARRHRPHRQLPAQLPGVLPRHRADRALCRAATRPRTRRPGGAREPPGHTEEHQGQGLLPEERLRPGPGRAHDAHRHGSRLPAQRHDRDVRARPRGPARAARARVHFTEIPGDDGS
ncbi:HAD-IIIC family phosphatase [Streptomyces sp. GLT-R25]